MKKWPGRSNSVSNCKAMDPITSNSISNQLFKENNLATTIKLNKICKQNFLAYRFLVKLSAIILRKIKSP